MEQQPDTYTGTYAPTEQIPGGTPDHMITIQDAAQVLSVSPSTIRRWVKEGKIKSERVSRPQGYVVLVQLPTRQVSGQISTERPSGHVPQVSTAAPTDLERADAMAAYTRSILEPLVAELGQARERIEALAQQNGSLTNQTGTLSQLTEQQAERIRQLEEQLTARVSFWQRWFGWLGFS